MTTVTLQRIRSNTEGGGHSQLAGGPVTGNSYVIDPLGRVTVDVLDAAYFVAKGWSYYEYGAGGGTSPTSGITTVNFGPFPGSSSATTTVAVVDANDPNAVIDAWITPVATADHSADEHQIDPPLVVAAQISGSNIVINAYPSGRDLAVPPGTPFGQANTSQMPIGKQQCMPYGAWTVAWAFAP